MQLWGGFNSSSPCLLTWPGLSWYPGDAVRSWDPRGAIAKPRGGAGSASVGLVSPCRWEGPCRYPVFGSSALLGDKHGQFEVFLQPWGPPSIRVHQGLGDIRHARAVNREMI